ncbi:MAG: hypothetical protein ACI4JC_09805, partial [Faecalibacterium sp.]
RERTTVSSVFPAQCCGRRLSRTKFLPLFCSGVGQKAGIPFGRLMKFSRNRERKCRHAREPKDFVGDEVRQKGLVAIARRQFFLGNRPLKVVVLILITTTFCRRC